MTETDFSLIICQYFIPPIFQWEIDYEKFLTDPMKPLYSYKGRIGFLLKYFGFKKSETKRSKISPENELLPSACLIHK